MRDTPSIHREPSPIRFLPWPLDRHIARAHDRLPDIVEAMIHMVFLLPQQHIIKLLRVVVRHAGLQGESVSSDVRETMQLMEERDVVDLALRCLLARLEVVGG